MTGRKIPRWESELWSYVSSGDGMHCPLLSHCQTRQSGNWCPDDDRKYLTRLLDSRRPNLSKYDFMKGGASGRIFELMERLAQQQLKKGEVHYPPVPTEIIPLTDNQRPIKARLLPLKAYYGAIWRLREGWVIQLRHDDTPATRRFTLFHEAFHILAHCHCKTIPRFRKRGLKEGYFNELLADYFACCMLMPKQWVKEKWAAVNNLNQMAKIFDVPKPAMWLRLKCLGLI